MKKWVATALVAALSLGMFVCQAWLMSREGFASVRAVDEDYWWFVYDEEKVPRCEADQMIAADGMLFLHYERYGYVNVYSTDGTFLRGYQVASGRNGRGGIGYADGILYIDGRCSGIYLFRGEELLRFEEQSIHNPSYREIELYMDAACPMTDGGYDYYYHSVSGQINRAKPGQELETVLQLPVENPNVETLAYANLILWACFSVWSQIEKGEVPAVSQILQERKRRLRS